MVDHSLFIARINLPAVDIAASLQHCGDWAFLIELLQDTVHEGSILLHDLRAAADHNDHSNFYKAARKIKSAASPLHLPLLADASAKAEALGKLLVLRGHDVDLLQCRDKLVETLELGYDQLEAYFLTAETKGNVETDANETEDDE